VILTLRSAEQGGHTTPDFEARRYFWTSLFKMSGNAFFDLELDMAVGFTAEEPAAKLSFDWNRIHLLASRFRLRSFRP